MSQVFIFLIYRNRHLKQQFAICCRTFKGSAMKTTNYVDHHDQAEEEEEALGKVVPENFVLLATDRMRKADTTRLAVCWLAARHHHHQKFAAAADDDDCDEEEEEEGKSFSYVERRNRQAR